MANHDFKFRVLNIRSKLLSTATLSVAMLVGVATTNANPIPMLLGDVDGNGEVNFLDIGPFIACLTGGDFKAEADVDQSGEVNFLDIAPFIAILTDTEDEILDGDIVISNNNSFMMARGEGSRIEIHGADARKETWTQLAETANPGSSQLIVQEDTRWEVGDSIAVASTSRDWTEAEEFTVTAISSDGRTITLDAPLQFTHLGVTRHYDNGQTGEDHREWDIEARAEVALLNRNITIQGDEDSVQDGFGGHSMVMEGAEQHVEGAEFNRMGQRDRLGRYPIHWHVQDIAEGQYVQNVSVHNSHQKGVTIHGTSNIRLEETVVYDHVGHGVFFEDGSENDNQVINNLVFSTRRSLTGLPIPTDAANASSYWIENPNNMIIGNHAAGSQSNGFWILEDQFHGLSAQFNVGAPGQYRDLIFINNTSHTTNGDEGAGGTDKLLGLDGILNNDLSLRQNTRDGEFGIIQGFTGYNGPSWALTAELVFSDCAFWNSRFFSRHENYIEDTVFDGNTTVLYRDGGSQYNNVHVAGGTRFLTVGSDHVNTPHAFNNLTGNPRFVISNGAVNQQSIVDIDGSQSGIEGGFLTAQGDLFDAAPGAPAALLERLSDATIGATEVTALGITGNLSVVRSDGQSVVNIPNSTDRRVAGDDARDRSDANKEFFTTTGLARDLAYFLDFDDMPAELRLNLTDVRAGDAAVYEIPGIAGTYRVTEGGVRVNSLEELLAANTTSYYRGDSSVFVRIVAVDNGIEPDRLVPDLLASYKASDSITMDITGFTGSSGQLSPELILAIDASAENGVNNTSPEIFVPAQEHSTANFNLVRYASSSEPVAVNAGMSRWSDNIWGGRSPGANDIVVINAGETVVLDRSVTVKGIIVNGGELIVEDDANLDIDLSTDYLLIINGGLFQAGTETKLLDTDFTLTLEGDDPEFDLNVTSVLTGRTNRLLADTAGSGTPE